jgi:hypothetical protein
LSAVETWLLVLVKVDGAVVMNTGPDTGAATGPTAGAAVAALALDTGAAIAIALRTAGTHTRRVRVELISSLPFNLHVTHQRLAPLARAVSAYWMKRAGTQFRWRRDVSIMHL